MEDRAEEITLNESNTEAQDQPEIADTGSAEESQTDFNTDSTEGTDAGISAPETADYEKIIASDITVLKSEFSELRDIEDITDLNDPLRYAALRDLGLSPEEAYMATAKRVKNDTRSHLSVAYAKSASAGGAMPRSDLEYARELFGNLSDSEIHALYRKVTK